MNLAPGAVASAMERFFVASEPVIALDAGATQTTNSQLQS